MFLQLSYCLLFCKVLHVVRKVRCDVYRRDSCCSFNVVHIFHNFFFIPTGQQRDLKWSLAGVQLFSGEGLDTCVRVLQKLCSVLLQPWRRHGHMGPTPQRCMILSICISTLRLLRTMLTELLRGGAFQFRDTRVASVLVTLHMIVCSIPASGRLDGEETRVQALIVDVLLTFTQGVNEEVCE